MSSNSQPSGHAVLFPFMAKGHTIPLLHLARFLLSRNLAVTVFTTPSNRPFISHSLSDTKSSIIDLPFPQSIPDIPAGVESTDRLSSMSLIPSFVLATKSIQPHFELALECLIPRVTFVVSDGFLWWTLDSTSKFGVPRLVFYGICAYANSLARVVIKNLLPGRNESNNESITVPTFPWIKVTKNDFDAMISDPEPNRTPASGVFMNCVKSTMSSFGMLFNSFYELEPLFVDFWNRECQPRAWCIGPLCLAQPVKSESSNKPVWIQWLDQKLDQDCPVLYVAFGSQAEVSPEQIKEIAIALEESNVNFLWVIRKKESEISDIGFENRVKSRGLVVRDWVDQREILMHESVQGFLSHCGWNSVLESICAGVPILAWPMMAEQPLNAKMVVEEIKVGLRVETCDGSVKGFVRSEGLKKMVKALMEGDKGKDVRKKTKEVAAMANKAVEEGGSSWSSLESLINEICQGQAVKLI
ncbi:hypothetical protein FNV43_RR14370 [Rhamnella rubrinervis]|uniref:Glycosyltransferase n=1 Tax=Rhamnella rubrinervis TaxID=2594499 RepID=A0A8K0H2P2_9ROSA|nr:hypothetical protein FNV43_RR14370 [Rhamnella rubrinervis]